MVSFPGRGVGKRPRGARLPGGGGLHLHLAMVVMASLVVTSSCLTGSHNHCPRHLDCALAGRHLCLPPNTRCGSCVSPLVENKHGKCVPAAPRVDKETTYPELDEEIDFLSTIIGEQRETARIPASPAQDVPEPKKEKTVAPSPAHRSTTTQSPPPNSTAQASTANLTAAARLSNPNTLPYPANDYVFIVMSGVFVAAACLAFTISGICWVRLQRGVRLAQKVDYPAYGPMAAHSYDNTVPGDKKLAHGAQMYHYQHPGDKKLAHSAQMYHYQHQKQQMLSLEKQRDEPKVSDSGATSDEENEDGDFTVYECPGLAPTGEMEVKNPLFDDSTLYHQRFHK